MNQPHYSTFRSILAVILFHVFLVHRTAGQDHLERYGSIDVLSYRFYIELNDSTDQIEGEAEVKIKFKSDLEQFYLDLVKIRPDGRGMVIKKVSADGMTLPYIHHNDTLSITGTQFKNGMTRKYKIMYQGIPEDGLIISKNMFGDRTFFGDNWPDRAHHWLPVVDHPSDKATVEFVVNAPGHYAVVSNGRKIEEIRYDDRLTSRWKTSVPLPTKLMVIGVSRFAIQYLESPSGIPVSSWVYPQNSEMGFYDYSLAIRPLDFFESYIGPYPFSKLANVQSKTVYGGMENASCIFYRETSISGQRSNEFLFAHEIAHQWFGDAVSEMNWHHIWLSEGFATYLTDLYREKIHGREAFISSLKEERNEVIQYSKIRLTPIIDTAESVSVRLLNKNTYDKAAWVLHMLRKETGDDLFREFIRAFYRNYRYGNALTNDFRLVVDSVSGSCYETFFRQWFYVPGHPVLSASWEYNEGIITLKIRQHQESSLFSFPLDVQFIVNKGFDIRKTFQITTCEHIFKICSKERPDDLILDPDCWLLFEHYDSPGSGNSSFPSE